MTSDPATLAFVMPGFVHRIGNAIFTMQGLAQLPDRPVPHATVLAATDRATAALRVARALMGPSWEPPQPAGDLLEVIADLTRLQLRERGQTLTLALPEGAGASGPSTRHDVDAGSFCPAVVIAIRLLAEALPVGATGGVRVRLTAGGGVVQVALSFAPAAGELPFPLAWSELAGALAQALGGARPDLRIEATAGLRLCFAATESGPANLTKQA